MEEGREGRTGLVNPNPLRRRHPFRPSLQRRETTRHLLLHSLTLSVQRREAVANDRLIDTLKLLRYRDRPQLRFGKQSRVLVPEPGDVRVVAALEEVAAKDLAVRGVLVDGRVVLRGRTARSGGVGERK